MAMLHEISFASFEREGAHIEKIIGVFDIIEWVLTEYETPLKPGRYLTADGQGHTRLLHTTGDTNRMYQLFFENFSEDIVWDDGTQLTDREIVQLSFNGFDTWFTYKDIYDADGYSGQALVIFKNKPKYWLKSAELTGPIDEERDRLPIHHTDRLYLHSRNFGRFDKDGRDTYKDLPL